LPNVPPPKRAIPPAQKVGSCASHSSSFTPTFRKHKHGRRRLDSYLTAQDFSWKHLRHQLHILQTCISEQPGCSRHQAKPSTPRQATTCRNPNGRRKHLECGAFDWRRNSAQGETTTRSRRTANSTTTPNCDLNRPDLRTRGRPAQAAAKLSHPGTALL